MNVWIDAFWVDFHSETNWNKQNRPKESMVSSEKSLTSVADLYLDLKGWYDPLKVPRSCRTGIFLDTMSMSFSYTDSNWLPDFRLSVLAGLTQPAVLRWRRQRPGEGSGVSGSCREALCLSDRRSSGWQTPAEDRRLAPVCCSERRHQASLINSSVIL